MHDVHSALGSVGFLAIEGSYVPQIVRLFRTKRAEDVSILFPALNLLGRLFALSYAVSKGEDVFVVGLTVGVLLRVTLLLQVLWYRRLRGWGVRAPAGVSS